ncbi:MAG: hypothetical protein MOB07_14860 [Acidobacteria bacterium]|nr:hypothetical protein [Acidobacteriota bacterium]
MTHKIAPILTARSWNRRSAGRSLVLMINLLFWVAPMSRAFACTVGADLRVCPYTDLQTAINSGPGQDQETRLLEPGKPIERERQERARLAGELEKLKRPRGAPPVFILSIVRSGGTGQPVNRIVLPPSAPRIILSLEMEPDPDLQSYRATLQTADNRELWSESDLRLNSKDALRLDFNTEIFKPGDYLITLEGLTAQGRYVPAAKYSFRAAKKE